MHKTLKLSILPDTRIERTGTGIIKRKSLFVSTPGFPAPESVPIMSEIACKGYSAVVLRNSKFLCLLTLLGSLFAAFIGVCMLVMALASLFPGNGFSASGLWNALSWAVGALAMIYLCAGSWRLGRDMAGFEVQLNNQGVSFKLGSRKKPAALFIPWDQITAVRRRRVGNVQKFQVEAKNGDEARFSSYTFFRPKKVARMIAERAGLTMQNL